MTIQIISSVKDAAAYIEACLDSVRAQTHGDWHLTIRDDGSSDDTSKIIARIADDEPRITLAYSGGDSIGAAAGFAWVLAQIPINTEVVACIDGDDLWRPTHLERSLETLRAAGAGPVLIHGDLEVVDTALNTLHESFWATLGLSPEPADLRRIAVANVVTGSTIVMNGALAIILRNRATTGAAFQDSWFALAAAAFGRIVARRDITVRYRQHGTNSVGARAPRSARLLALPRVAREAFDDRERFRRDLERTTTQAAGFLQVFHDLLKPADAQFLQRYAAIPQHDRLRRALEVIWLRQYPGRSPLRALGEALRA